MWRPRKSQKDQVTQNLLKTKAEPWGRVAEVKPSGADWLTGWSRDRLRGSGQSYRDNTGWSTKHRAGSIGKEELLMRGSGWAEGLESVASSSTCYWAWGLTILCDWLLQLWQRNSSRLKLHNCDWLWLSVHWAGGCRCSRCARLLLSFTDGKGRTIV